MYHQFDHLHNYKCSVRVGSNFSNQVLGPASVSTHQGESKGKSNSLTSSCAVNLPITPRLKTKS